MSEIVDLVMPVLQSIQARLGTIERDVKRIQEDHGSKLEDLDIHLAYLAGIESQNRFDLNALRQRVKAAEGRIAALEP